MRVITAGQLRARLGEALDDAAAGERIVIERDHHRVAAIVPIEDAMLLDGQGDEARRRKAAAMERIERRAQRMKEVSARSSEWDAEATLRWERDHGHEDSE